MGHPGLIPGLGRSPGKGKGYPPQAPHINISLCLAYFTHIVSSSFIQVVSGVRISFFYRLNKSVVCTCHICFIRPSVSRHLGCTHFLAALNTAAVNMGAFFHTVHGVLKARILKWFAIPFSSGPHFVRTLHYDPSVLGGPTRHGS